MGQALLSSSTPKFTVAWLGDERLIIASQNGFWSPSDVVDFGRELLGAVGKASGQPFDFLTDMSNHVAQSQEVVALHHSLAVKVATEGLRHAVIVGASPLLGRQVKRGTGELGPHFATSVSAGRQWLKNQISS